ncbi:MAG: Unknown protein [uncultured Sulfurovum sp.]|uniref:Uncharacterized protein n=1 Tax=uncultured Sulfurovum sp. TaxID=269237 RepID=A0A6S6S4V5_9BACT|nr:MAG: Unknown protein [uncultured Sulfurovum sp.]
MKKTRLFLILTALVGLVWGSMYAWNTERSKLETFSTAGKYLKPGAAVDISYTTQRVAIDEVANIDITLSSGLTKGDVSVKVSLDDDLIEESSFEKELTYQLNEQDNDYKMNLNVSSEQDGLFYIRLFVTIDGTRSRSFAIPIYVGENIQNKQALKPIITNSNGDRLSVSTAKESISTIE